MSEFPQVLTFYSFKGGVGRSMAVLNVAYGLAARGRNVLVLDMDLEAPGLSGFLRRHDEIDELAPYDMVDLLEWAARFSAARREGQPTDRASLPPLTDYVVSVKREKLESLRPSRGELGRVDVIPVDEQRDYYTRLTEQAIGSFDHDTLLQIGRVLNVWLKSREFAVEVPEYYGAAGVRTAKYDYVLVDSRTGVTEIGGLCIGPLSDQLVVFTGLNDQNVAGTHDFLKQVGILEDTSDANKVSGQDESTIHRLDPKPTMIVATPVPSGELKMKNERLEALRAKVGTVVGRLSYHPQLALMETVFVRDHPNEYLALEYGDLVDRVMRLANDGTGFDTNKFFGEFLEAPRDEQRELANQAIRFCSTPEGSPFALQWLLQAIPLESVNDETDFVLLDRICRFLVGHHDDVDYAVLNHWGNLLASWAFQTPAQEQQHLVRRDAALARHAQVLAAENSSAEQKVGAYISRGITKRQSDDHQGAIDDYSAVLEMPDATAEQKAGALINRGLEKFQLDDHRGSIADYTAVVEMPDAPAKRKAMAVSCRGWNKFRLGQFPEAIADYRHAISIDKQYCLPQENLAIALLVSGQADDALRSYDQALALANLEDIADMEQDLTDALEKHDSIAGAAEVRDRLAKRRAELEK